MKDATEFHAQEVKILSYWHTSAIFHSQINQIKTNLFCNYGNTHTHTHTQTHMETYSVRSGIRFGEKSSLSEVTNTEGLLVLENVELVLMILELEN